jgi:hypothetical protein
MSRLILASMLLVAAVSSGCWAQAPAESPLRGSVQDWPVPRLCYGSIAVGPGYRFRFSGSIVQPGGERRSGREVECDGQSLVVRDLAAATSERHPADDALCEAIVRRLAKGSDCPGRRTRRNDAK